MANCTKWYTINELSLFEVGTLSRSAMPDHILYILVQPSHPDITKLIEVRQ